MNWLEGNLVVAMMLGAGLLGGVGMLLGRRVQWGWLVVLGAGTEKA